VTNFGNLQRGGYGYKVIKVRHLSGQLAAYTIRGVLSALICPVSTSLASGSLKWAPYIGPRGLPKYRNILWQQIGYRDILKMTDRHTSSLNLAYF